MVLTLSLLDKDIEPRPMNKNTTGRKSAQLLQPRLFRHSVGLIIICRNT